MSVLALLGSPLSSAQEVATPEASTSTTPSDSATTSVEISPGAPHLQTIAQGIVTIEGPITWRVREFTLGSTGAPEVGDAAFSLQRSGAAIIRNELTGRRVRLDAGEAAFQPAGDPFLRFGVGAAPSVLLTVDLLSPEAVASSAPASTVLFTSDAINDYPRGSFEVELSRDVLLPGEVVVLPPSTGPALVMVTTGSAEASLDGGQAARLEAGNARLVSGNVSLRNPGSQAAAIVVAGLGEPVDGVEEGFGPDQSPPAASVLPTVPADLPPIATIPAQVPTAPDIAPTPVPNVEQIPVPTLPAQQDSATADTDADFIADIDEINIYNTDPNAWDTDGDGLGDGEEAFGFGTDPLRWDTDGDGVSDGDEVNVYGTNPLDPASGP